MPQEATPTAVPRPEEEPHAPDGGSAFANSRMHAALAYLATRRWPRLFGYGALIVACRVVRTIIRA